MARPPSPVDQITKAAVRKRAQRAMPLDGAACSRCGSRICLERHHPDYSKPTQVEVLCARCHHDDHLTPKILPACSICAGPLPTTRRKRNTTICQKPECRRLLGKTNAEKRWGTERTDSGREATASSLCARQSHLSSLLGEQELPHDLPQLPLPKEQHDTPSRKR